MNPTNPPAPTEAAPDPALVGLLNELLEAERAGARVTRETAQALPEGSPLQALVLAVYQDEAHWCSMLLAALRSLGAQPSTRTGDFYGRAMALADIPERLAFLNRGQGWVARKLRALLADALAPEALRPGLQAMLDGHEAKLALVNQQLARRSGPAIAPNHS